RDNAVSSTRHLSLRSLRLFRSEANQTSAGFQRPALRAFPLKSNPLAVFYPLPEDLRPVAAHGGELGSGVPVLRHSFPAHSAPRPITIKHLHSDIPANYHPYCWG